MEFTIEASRRRGRYWR